MELCTANRMSVANTFKPTEPEKTVTYYELGGSPMAPITTKGFAQLDLLLMPADMLDRLVHIQSDRTEALASHHFLLEATLGVNVPKRDVVEQKWRKDRNALRNTSIKESFVHSFEAMLESSAAMESTTAEKMSLVTVDAFNVAEKATLPFLTAKPKHDWTSSATLRLIDERSKARKAGNYQLEKALQKQLRKQSRVDRKVWVDEMASSGDWSKLQVLYRNKTPQQGRLHSIDGKLVESSQRAETFAEYLAKVQWAVRPVRIIDRPPLFGALDVCCDPPSYIEVQLAVKRIKNGRAAGSDGIPIEYWKSVFDIGGPGAEWLTKLLQICWQEKACRKSGI